MDSSQANTYFFVAFRSKNYVGMEKALSYGADINRAHRPDESGNPLRIACEDADTNMICFLVAHGADVNRPMPKNQDYLQVLIRHHHLTCAVGIDAILNAKPDLSGTAGRKALLAAIQGDQEPLAVRLLGQGASWRTMPEDSFETSPILQAAHRRQKDVVDWLHGLGEDLHLTRMVSPTQTYGVMAAAIAVTLTNGADAIPLLQWLKEKGVPPDGEGTPALVEAIVCSRVKDALWLLENGADPNRPSGHDTPIAIADFYHRTEIFRALLEHGADTRELINSTGGTVHLNSSLLSHVARNGALMNDITQHLATEGGLAAVEKLLLARPAAGKPPKLLGLAGGHQLEALFHPELWAAHPPEAARKFLAVLARALPPFLQAQLDAVDVSWTYAQPPEAWKHKVQRADLLSRQGR